MENLWSVKSANYVFPYTKSKLINTKCNPTFSAIISPIYSPATDVQNIMKAKEKLLKSTDNRSFVFLLSISRMLYLFKIIDGT